jgi:hypothetical protein
MTRDPDHEIQVTQVIGTEERVLAYPAIGGSMTGPVPSRGHCLPCPAASGSIDVRESRAGSVLGTVVADGGSERGTSELVVRLR